jgi:hypothetical protein
LRIFGVFSLLRSAFFGFTQGIVGIPASRAAVPQEKSERAFAALREVDRVLDVAR